MPRRVISFGARPRISSPPSFTLPVARTRPVMALHSVVLPMPLRPTMPEHALSSVKLTPCSAWARP
jgi:hypothetical protein